MTSAKMLKITLVRSTIGFREDQKATAKALGLKKLNATVEREDTPSIRGLIFKISHLLKVEEMEQSS